MFTATATVNTANTNIYLKKVILAVRELFFTVLIELKTTKILLYQCLWNKTLNLAEVCHLDRNMTAHTL